MYTCAECGKEFTAPSRNQIKGYRRRNHRTIYCSTECSYNYRARLSSRRMSEHNPMEDPETRAKVSRALRRIGHSPPVQGGKGTGLTEPQAMLLNELPQDWEAEYPITTGNAKGEGPTFYSADLALAELQLCVEVDGSSHRTLERQKQDAIRDETLHRLGWRTLRFTNEEIKEDLRSVVSAIRSTTCKLRARETSSQRAFSSTTAT
ncbi:MAG: DUF559 domain-containing protein [Candidatus Brocadiia bacterium]